MRAKKGVLEMICKNCGTNNKEGSTFCEVCGSPIEAATYAPVPPKAQKSAGGVAVGEIVGSIIADIKTVDKKVLAKAISVLLAVVTIFTMMWGWAKVDEQTFNIFQLRRAVSETNEYVQETLDEYDVEDMAEMFDNGNMKKFKSTGTKLTISSILLILDILVFWVAFLALAGFIFLMMIKNKNAAFLGQLACLIVAATVILFAIATLIVGKLKIGGGFDMAFGLFIPLLAAAGNFVFITMKKDDVRA